MMQRLHLAVVTASVSSVMSSGVCAYPRTGRFRAHDQARRASSPQIDARNER